MDHQTERSTTEAPPSSGTARPARRRLLSRRSRDWLALAVVALAALIAWLRAPATPAEAPREPDPLPVSVVEVELADHFEVTERLAGRMVSRRRSELGFERAGRLAQVLVDQGDRIEAGGLLAELDLRQLEAERREQAARVESTRARLELARATARRQQRLHDSDYASPQTLDEALSGQASLEAQLSADRASLERTDVAIELSRLRAPYDAIVTERFLDEGTVAGSGQPVLAILEAGVQEVQIGIPPEIASRLEIGTRHRVESGESGRIATLRRIVPELDPATRTLTAVLEVETDAEAASAEPRMADGSLVWVRFEQRVPARGSWVPMGALAEGRRGTWTAYAVVDDGQGGTRVERRVVQIIQAEERRAFVRGTLREGDRLVSDGLHRLTPGSRVRVVGGHVANRAS